MEKTGLVLEGGGVRGAFTAGALAWLTENHIQFDYAAGISSGAVYLCCYEMDNTRIPYMMSVHYSCDPENVGIKAFGKEGHYVAYKHIFDHYLLETEHMDVTPLIDSGRNFEVGSYDLKQGKTIWFGPADLDAKMTILRGACALPIASAIVPFRDHLLLDGGITKMIPIERALEQGCTKCLVITTKPADYVRKPAPGAIKGLMHMVYPKYPQISKDYTVRHENYYKQMDLIENLVQEDKAIMIRPSETINVSRWRGNEKDCERLYQLGKSDMEAHREEIEKFLEEKK